MSVIQVTQQQQQRNGILGTLGAFATLAGAMTGQPWLTALGTGASGVDAMMNGDTSSSTAKETGGALSEVLEGLKEVWKNPADDNPADTPAKSTLKKLGKIANKNSSNATAPTSIPSCVRSDTTMYPDIRRNSFGRW